MPDRAIGIVGMIELAEQMGLTEKLMVGVKKVDRERIGKLLEKLRTDERKDIGAAQPGLTLGCFYGLKVEDNSVCLGCEHYHRTCELYLKSFFNAENLFDRQKNVDAV